MKEIHGDLWDYWLKEDHFVCITLSRSIKNNGRAVMGRGCAAQAKHRFPLLDREVALTMRRTPAPFVYTLDEPNTGRVLIGVVTKNTWHHPSSVALITAAMRELGNVAARFPRSIFVLPRPGCGHGGLDWETQVKPIAMQYLPNNVHVITKKREDV